MIYDGTEAHENGESNIDRIALEDIAWNKNYNDDVKYVGYMYGGLDGEASTTKTEAQTNETSSNMKKILEDWYEENLKENYGQYLADVIFCNDRSTPNSSYASGYGTESTLYGAYDRFVVKKSAPTFICPENNAVNVTIVKENIIMIGSLSK